MFNLDDDKPRVAAHTLLTLSTSSNHRAASMFISLLQRRRREGDEMTIPEEGDGVVQLNDARSQCPSDQSILNSKRGFLRYYKVLQRIIKSLCVYFELHLEHLLSQESSML